MNDKKKSVDTYLNEIGGRQLLTDEEEKALSERIQRGDSEAVNALVQANLTFVVSMARQYRSRGLDMEDLISEGNIGLMRAASRYRAEHDKRFVAFAAPFVREAIEKAIEQQSGLYRVPRNVMDGALEKKRSRALSIDAPIGGSAELSLGRVIPNRDAPDPDRMLEEELSREKLGKLVDALPQRQRYVLERVYGIGMNAMTMAEIAEETGLKRERVRQIRDQALRNIKRYRRKVTPDD